MTLTNLLTSIASGDYRPAHGSAGAILLEAHPSSDPFTAGRSLSVFARAAYRRSGLWWALALEAAPELLSDDEAAYLAASRKQWCCGSNPFRGGARRVTA